MRKGIRLVCLTVSVLLLAAFCLGCASNSAKTVVATVDGNEIYRWEVDKLYNDNRSAYEEQSGISLDDPTNFDKKLEFRKALLDTLVKNMVVVCKANDTGYALTDAEKTQIKADFDAKWQKNIQFVLDESYGGDTAKWASAEKDWLAKVSENNMDYDFLLQAEYETAVHEKLTTELFKDAGATEEEMLATYDEMVADYKAKYEESTETFAADAATPGRVPYYPAGYVRVKYIMMTYPDDIQKQIEEVSAEWQKYLEELMAVAVQKGETNLVVDEIDTQETNAKLEELAKKGHEAIKAEAEEMAQKVAQGQDFDALLEEYGEDATMAQYPYNTHGLIFGPDTVYDEALTDVVLALENPGDTTSLIELSNGYVVAQLVEKLEEGPVPFEQMRDFIYELRSLSPITQIYEDYASAALTEFAEAGRVETFENRL